MTHHAHIHSGPQSLNIPAAHGRRLGPGYGESGGAPVPGANLRQPVNARLIATGEGQSVRVRLRGGCRAVGTTGRSRH